MQGLADSNSEVRWQAVLAAPRCGIDPLFIPRGISRRPRTAKNPFIAAIMNFLLPGLGYGYIGKWWGIMIFQIDVTATVWLYKYEGQGDTYRPALSPVRPPRRPRLVPCKENARFLKRDRPGDRP